MFIHSSLFCKKSNKLNTSWNEIGISQLQSKCLYWSNLFHLSGIQAILSRIQFYQSEIRLYIDIQQHCAEFYLNVGYITLIYKLFDVGKTIRFHKCSMDLRMIR